jgi:hypothetical protein
MAVDYTESIKDIEFINVFPSMSHVGHVFLMTAITDKDHRVLVYAPLVKVGDYEIASGYDYDADWHTSLYNIVHRRYCKFITDLFAVESLNKNGEFFKIIYLDGDFKQKIKKEEIEKMFGCEIDG